MIFKQYSITILNHRREKKESSFYRKIIYYFVFSFENVSMPPFYTNNVRKLRHKEIKLGLPSHILNGVEDLKLDS